MRARVRVSVVEQCSIMGFTDAVTTRALFTSCIHVSPTQSPKVRPSLPSSNHRVVVVNIATGAVQCIIGGEGATQLRAAQRGVQARVRDKFSAQKKST